MSDTGRRLRALRERLALSQDEVGKRLGHSQRWISQREMGSVDLSLEETHLICAAMGYRANLLITPADHDDDADLMAALPTMDPDDALLALRLARALPRLTDNERGMIAAIVDIVAERPWADSAPLSEVPALPLAERVRA